MFFFVFGGNIFGGGGPPVSQGTKRRPRRGLAVPTAKGTLWWEGPQGRALWTLSHVERQNRANT